MRTTKEKRELRKKRNELRIIRQCRLLSKLRILIFGIKSK